jgi:hypothetical protein
MKIKKIFTLMLSVAFALNSSIFAFAATENTLKDQEVITKHEITEIQNYMKTHQIALTLEEQTQTYSIPLSNGENAVVEISLTRPGNILHRDIYVAKLGKWDINYKANIPSKGSINLKGSFNVTQVPNMKDSSRDCPKFNVTGSSISVVPPQTSSVIDKGSSYKTVQTNHEYSVSGYASFKTITGVTMNYYVDMLMYCKTNTGSDRDKIYVDTNLSV